MLELTVKTTAKRQIVNINKDVEAILEKGFSGQVALFVKHTTAALTTADLDPGTDQDMLEAFYGMIPKLNFRHPHDPQHAPDHILASLIGPDVMVPVEKGKLQLGTWQEVVLCEFDGPRDRTISINKLS